MTVLSSSLLRGPDGSGRTILQDSFLHGLKYLYNALLSEGNDFTGKVSWLPIHPQNFHLEQIAIYGI